MIISRASTDDSATFHNYQITLDPQAQTFLWLAGTDDDVLQDVVCKVTVFIMATIAHLYAFVKIITNTRRV